MYYVSSSQMKSCLIAPTYYFNILFSLLSYSIATLQSQICKGIFLSRGNTMLSILFNQYCIFNVQYSTIGIFLDLKNVVYDISCSICIFFLKKQNPFSPQLSMALVENNSLFKVNLKSSVYEFKSNEFRKQYNSYQQKLHFTKQNNTSLILHTIITQKEGNVYYLNILLGFMLMLNYTAICRI